MDTQGNIFDDFPCKNNYRISNHEFVDGILFVFKLQFIN